MEKIIDARGLSCPQPVLITLTPIRSIKKGELVITVDTDTPKENVSRAAESEGWKVTDLVSEESGYGITIKKD